LNSEPVTGVNLNIDSPNNINRIGLKNGVLSLFDVIGQSIGGIAPSATPALVIPLVFATAGNGTWLAYLFATIAILLVGLNLNHFTSRSASAGSLYSYIAQGLGPGAGVISGWALVLAYTLTASAVLCGFINYANVLLAYGGIAISPYILALIGTLSAWYVGYKDIKLSTKLMLILEFISLTLIVVLVIIVLAIHGFHWDPAQYTLAGVSSTSIRIGLVLAFFSFTCFESSATLGDEARNPIKTIPRAIISSIVLVGGIFILTSYTEVLGFHGSPVTLDQAEAPLALLATRNGVDFFGPLISIGALISFWACILGCANAGSRILFTMGKHNLIHNAIGNAHSNNQTPHIALTITSLLLFVIPVILISQGGGLFDIYGWVGTIATFGFLLNYALISIAAPVYLKHEGELKPQHVLLSLITILVLAVPIIGSLYPLPAPPYKYFSFIFAAWLIAGGLWYFIRKANTDVVAEINRDLDQVHDYYRDIKVREGGEYI